MDFENFNPARDFYYLAFLCLGAGVGCILNRLRKKSTHRSRNWAVVAGLCFFSGALASLTIAVIYSNGRILLETSLYPYLGILAMLMILACRFTRAAGFPLILILGVFTIWISYGYLRFPVVDDSGRMRITREANGLVYVIPVPKPSDKHFPVLSFQADRDDQALEFRAFCFSFNRVLPIIGGVCRGDIAEIRCEEELLFADPRFSSKLLPGLFLGADNVLSSKRLFSFKEIPALLELGELGAGKGLTVFFDGENLTFH